jgi:RNA polymerase sigma factor (sigma-70 family)
MASAPRGAALRQIQRVFGEGTISGLSDSQLLEKFLDQRDDAAFTALVERHGPMVLETCRAVLRNADAAEDAFQATFLVLVCKARSIRGRDALGGWLHRVAYRIAIQAGEDAARVRTRERSVGDLHAEDRSRTEPGNDWREILHEEVARLSDKYRLPVLLCDLEGKTHAEAAHELNWGEATVRRRLASARDLLRSRLTRRGVGLSTAGLAATWGRSANAGVPAAWVQATVKAAGLLNSTAARIAIGEVVSTTAAALVRKSLQAMLLSNIKTCAAASLVFCVLGCIAWGVRLPREGQDSGSRKGRSPAPAANTSQLKAEKPSDADTTISYEGRVLDSGGRPFSGAAVYLISYGLKQPKTPPIRATSATDGRFRFAVPKSSFDSPDAGALWPYSTVVARAKGFAFGLANDHRGDGKGLTLQLVADDVPVAGRIIDLEGRPVAGVTVKVMDVRAPANTSLDGWLKALGERKEHHNLEREFLHNRLEMQWEPSIIPPVTTGPEGTFRIVGIGRERVATIQLEGPTIETEQVEVRTRPGETIRVPSWKGFGNANLITIYGANFEHVVGPTRPIEGVVRDQDTGKPLAGVMVRGEQSLSFGIAAYVHSISDAQGRYRLVGLPRGKEGAVVAVPPCDFEVYGSRKAELKVPPDEQLPYLRARVAVEEERGTGPLGLDIGMKRGVWVTGRIIDQATGKPARGQVEYFVYNDNPHLKEYPNVRWARVAPFFIFKGETFRLVAFPGPGVLAARADEDRYIRGCGFESIKHVRHQTGAFECQPRSLGPDDFHTLAEIDPAPGTASLSHDLLLETGRTLTVTVLGPDGKPLPGTLISGLKDFQYKAFWQATPADASTHTVEGLKPGKPRVLTFAHQIQHLTGELVLQGDETAPHKVTLKPWGVLTGRVINADGEPWGEAEFNTILPAEGLPKVGKDGRFKIVGLIPGKPYTLGLVKDYRLRGTVAKDVKVGPGEVKDLGDLVPEIPKSE